MLLLLNIIPKKGLFPCILRPKIPKGYINQTEDLVIFETGVILCLRLCVPWVRVCICQCPSESVNMLL